MAIIKFCECGGSRVMKETRWDFDLGAERLMEVPCVCTHELEAERRRREGPPPNELWPSEIPIRDGGSWTR